LKKSNTEIIILGAGLTGLTIAYLLKKKGINASILEARNRIGGRILTLKNPELACVEMGATWLGKKHSSLIALIKELELEVFPQHLGNRAIYEPISTSPPQLVQLPPNDEPSFRIKHGTGSIIEALASKLAKDQIQLNTPVISIKQEENRMAVVSDKEVYHGDIIISTLPPALFIQSIQVTPQLPETLIRLAGKTHTWMGESIKVALSYKEPFWQKDNLSGTIFSSVGPIPEMYDHSDFENEHFSLMGFFNGSYYNVSKEERLRLILGQLQKYYGDVVHSYERYDELVWIKEEFTSVNYSEHVLPHENNGHSFYQEAVQCLVVIWMGR